jgi:isopenicillin N synthase-like dioxygenase
MTREAQGPGENWDFSPLCFGELPWHPESDAPEGVPILDLGVMLDERNPAARRAQLSALREAVTNSGFLYVKNHGISEGELEAIAGATRSFFGQPEEYKLAFDHHADVRGYTGYRFESTARFFGTSRGKDLCMKYTMGPELTPEQVRERLSSADDVTSNAYSPNVFPDARFREAWVRCYEQVHRVSTQLLALLGDALDLESESKRIWAEMLIEKSCGELRYLQYPDVPRDACADVDGSVPDRMATHFDLDVITLLHQTPCKNGFASLEAEVGGRFVKVPAIRGTLVVNLGEVIRLLTGGRVRATLHRVARPPRHLHQGSARDVTVFFQAPPLNAQLRPVQFSSSVGQDTLFDELYQAAGPAGAVTFSQLRSRLFAEFLRQSDTPEAAHEADAHLFAAPTSESSPQAATP